MTRKAKIWLGLGCGITLAMLIGGFWCFAVFVTNGAWGNSAYVNMGNMRYSFLYATAADFQRAQVVVSDTPRQFSPAELSRFISVKDASLHSTDPWGGTILVTVWRGTNSIGGFPNGGFCRGHIETCVGKRLWGKDYIASEE